MSNKLMDKLNEVADDLEDGNYHHECQFIRELVEYVQGVDVSGRDLLATELLEWIADYNW